jgi:hypothetical protein
MPDKLPQKIIEIIETAQKLTKNVYSTFDGKNAYSFNDQLRMAASLSEDRSVRVAVNELLHDLGQYFKGVGISQSKSDTQVFIEKDDLEARLTLLPPRSGGRFCSVHDLMRDVKALGIIHGVNMAAINAAWEKLTTKEEMILQLPIARGVPPKPTEEPQVEYVSKVLDKNLVFSEQGWVLQDFYTMMEHVEAGGVIAKVLPPTPGQPGVSVMAKEIPAPAPARSLPVKLGTNVKLAASGRELVATSAGFLVLEGDSLDVVPFYVVNGHLTSGANEISFNGNILVRGYVSGPLTLKGEDIYIEGNAEAASLFATGDVFIRGGIVGKKSGLVECDGKLFAHSISDAVIEALDDVVVRNSIVYSDVTSNSRLVVEAGVGVVVGGTVAALKGIVARSIGSDFGTFTKTSVGKDFLTPKRLQKVEEKIRVYEEKLAKIQDLKKKISDAGINLLNLPPEKQDILLSLLKHETQTRELMESLKRTRGKFQRAVEDILSASIKVLDKMHPPVQVQICESIKEIRERLNSVVLTLDAAKQIITRFGEIAR